MRNGKGLWEHAAPSAASRPCYGSNHRSNPTPCSRPEQANRAGGAAAGGRPAGNRGCQVLSSWYSAGPSGGGVRRLLLADLFELVDDDVALGKVGQDTQLAAILAATGSLDITTPVPESYHAVGDTPTLGQLVWLTHAGVRKQDLDGTSLRIRNSAGAIVATYTITLNSQGYPVVSTRAS